ncbi:MAG: hypothetical protein R2883_02870 [Caldisericia bacterium]
MTNKNNNKVTMPQSYLSKQVSINWASKQENPDKRPISESINGFFSEILFATAVFLILTTIVVLIWLVYLI